MNQSLADQLIKRYPQLYGVTFYFECGDGWFHIIEKLSKALQDESDRIQWGDIDPYPLVSQVKEKWGTLRFYLHSGTDRMYDLIDQAEAASKKTCEICGALGSIDTKHQWLMTLCDTHKLERKNN